MNYCKCGFPQSSPIPYKHSMKRKKIRIDWDKIFNETPKGLHTSLGKLLNNYQQEALVRFVNKQIKKQEESMMKTNNSFLFEKHWGEFKKLLELYLKYHRGSNVDWCEEFMNDFVKFTVSNNAKLLLQECEESK